MLRCLYKGTTETTKSEAHCASKYLRVHRMGEKKKEIRMDYSDVRVNPKIEDQLCRNWNFFKLTGTSKIWPTRFPCKKAVLRIRIKWTL